MVTTVIGSRFITYTYDRLNRLATVSENNIQTTYTYNTLGSRSRTTTRLNGALVTTTAYAYNIAGLPTAVANYGSDNLIVSSFSYTYRGDGNIASETDHNNVTTTYTYDLLGRLISEVGGHSRYYSYDAAGNRTQAIVDTATTISYTYDSDGRLISETSNNGSSLLTTSYAYDSNGSLISENDGDVTNYAYDVWGNMVSAGGASYAYNAQGLRVSKTVNGVTDSFVLVGGDVWADAESSYLRGLELISSSDYFYLYNIRGDVIQLLDYNGEVVKTYDYDAYGNELNRDLADENPFRYCGEYYDVETGLIYLRARYYDPSVGRFTSVDPAKDGLNWYDYCNCNPIVFVDPNGLRPIPNWVYKAICIWSKHRYNSENYNNNSTKEIPMPLGNSLIYSQSNTSISWMRYGNYSDDAEREEKEKYTFRNNGCEVVAVYNIMFLKNQRQEVYDIASYFEKNGHLVRSGEWGTNPFTLGEYFDDNDIEYGYYNSYSDFLDASVDSSLFIVSIWNTDDIRDGVHTFAIEYVDDMFFAYNYYSNSASQEPTKVTDLEELFDQKQFVVGYSFT